MTVQLFVSTLRENLYFIPLFPYCVQTVQSIVYPIVIEKIYFETDGYPTVEWRIYTYYIYVVYFTVGNVVLIFRVWFSAIGNQRMFKSIFDTFEMGDIWHLRPFYCRW